MLSVAPRSTVTQPGGAAWLEPSALLARALSDVLCCTPNGNDHCGALHGIWPDLRLLDLAAGPDRHADFYAEALGERAAVDGAERVLVAGCADSGMLETVVAAYGSGRAGLDLTVIDRCPVPVLLSAGYGAKAGYPVRTLVADLLDYSETESCEVICTHSLLTYSPLEARRRLVANWHQILRPGGVVVTVSRLTTEPRTADDRAARARTFGDLAAERCRRLGLVRDPVELRARAERFALAQVGYPVGDEADLRALFEQQGFEVTRLDVRTLDGSGHTPQPIMGAARSGVYGEIVAVRR